MSYYILWTLFVFVPGQPPLIVAYQLEAKSHADFAACDAKGRKDLAEMNAPHNLKPNQRWVFTCPLV